MPHHLDIHFSEEISSTHVQLVLMHENEGIINNVNEGLIETLLAACNLADFTGKSGEFLPVYSSHGPVLIAGIGKGMDAGLSAETWDGRLFKQMQSVPFNQLQVDADLLPA